MRRNVYLHPNLNFAYLIKRQYFMNRIVLFYIYRISFFILMFSYIKIIILFIAFAFIFHCMPSVRHNADMMVPAHSVYTAECPWSDSMPFPDCYNGFTLPPYVLPSHWLIRLLHFLPMQHHPIRSTALLYSIRDWPALPWCCWLRLRSSLDCSDSFFNGNRSAVVLQHVWLFISILHPVLFFNHVVIICCV